MNKKKVLTVMDLRSVNDVNVTGHAFEVSKVQNSVLFKIGQPLSESQVDVKCKDRNWTVNIVAYKRS